jgi:nicotinamide riboside kinase
MIEKVDQQINLIEGRIPRDLRDKCNKLYVKKCLLQKQLNENKLTAEEYVSVIKGQIEYDEKLRQYFLDKKLISKAEIVEQLITLQLKELRNFH